jgi:hypothetical protein
MGRVHPSWHATRNPSSRRRPLGLDARPRGLVRRVGTRSPRVHRDRGDRGRRENPVLPVTAFDQVASCGGPAVKKFMAGPSMSRRAASKPSRATHKSGRASAQAVWLRRRRSSINEPIASPPSATTGMTKGALRIVPPHCWSDGNPPPLATATIFPGLMGVVWRDGVPRGTVAGESSS